MNPLTKILKFDDSSNYFVICNFLFNITGHWIGFEEIQ